MKKEDITKRGIVVAFGEETEKSKLRAGLDKRDLDKSQTYVRTGWIAQVGEESMVVPPPDQFKR